MSTWSAAILLWIGLRKCHQLLSFFFYVFGRISITSGCVYIFFLLFFWTATDRLPEMLSNSEKKKLSIPPNGSACRKKMGQRMEQKWFSMPHKSQEIKRCWWQSWRWQIVLSVYWCREQMIRVPNWWPQNSTTFKTSSTLIRTVKHFSSESPTIILCCHGVLLWSVQ